jgi:hypothetical protein
MPVDTTSVGAYLNLTIDYKIWLRGQEAVDTGAYLMHPKSHKIDIVGNLLKHWSGESSALLGRRFLSQIAGNYASRNIKLDRPLSFLLTTSHTDTAEAYALMQLNDDPALSDDEREQAIAKFLLNYGIGIRFGEATKVKAPSAPKPLKDFGYTTVAEDIRLQEILSAARSVRVDASNRAVRRGSILNVEGANTTWEYVSPAAPQSNDTDI